MHHRLFDIVAWLEKLGLTDELGLNDTFWQHSYMITFSNQKKSLGFKSFYPIVKHKILFFNLFSPVRQAVAGPCIFFHSQLECYS